MKNNMINMQIQRSKNATLKNTSSTFFKSSKARIRRIFNQIHRQTQRRSRAQISER